MEREQPLWKDIKSAPVNEIVLVFHPRFVNPVTLGVYRLKPYQGNSRKEGWRVAGFPSDCWTYIDHEPLCWLPLPRSASY